jgi:predicted secreted protein
VWLVTDRDNGIVIEGSRSDLVVFRFEEHPSSGYLWQFDDLAGAGLAVRLDKHAATSSEQHIGSVLFRTVIAEPRDETGATGHVRLREVRPWEADGESLHSLELDVEFSGPVPAGLLPAQREALLGL